MKKTTVCEEGWSLHYVKMDSFGRTAHKW